MNVGNAIILLPGGGLNKGVDDLGVAPLGLLRDTFKHSGKDLALVHRTRETYRNQA